MMLQLNPTIPVLCKGHGDGEAFIVADYGPDVNSVYYVRFPGGIIKHFYSDDVRIYGNPMNGKGWDVDSFDSIKKLPAGAQRSTKFLKDAKSKQ